MSSRLFQSIRETHGLCYSIYSWSSQYADTGLHGIVTALSRDTEMRALRLISDELRRLLDEGVTGDELSRVREQVKSNLIMSLESTSARMQKLGQGELTFGHSLSPDEIIECYDAVTCEDILSLARSMYGKAGMSFSAVGRVASLEDYLSCIDL